MLQIDMLVEIFLYFFFFIFGYVMARGAINELEVIPSDHEELTKFCRSKCKYDHIRLRSTVQARDVETDNTHYLFNIECSEVVDYSYSALNDLYVKAFDFKSLVLDPSSPIRHFVIQVNSEDIDIHQVVFVPK
jgi:hypothetical protein